MIHKVLKKGFFFLMIAFMHSRRTSPVKYAIQGTFNNFKFKLKQDLTGKKYPTDKFRIKVGFQKE